MKLQGCPAIVTGAATGMGAAAAEALAQAGAKVALFDVNETVMMATAERIGGLGVVCDVSSEHNAVSAVAAARAAHGAARVLVNCAGVPQGEPFFGPDYSPPDLDKFKRVVDVNLTGTFNLIRLVASDLAKEEPLEGGERGVIINTASGAGHEGGAGQSAYVASKGGIISLTLALAREFGDLGIRVLTISPGAMDTPMLATVPDEIMGVLKSITPFPKRLGQPSEFAALALHLCENSFMNGEVIRMDGGARLPYGGGLELK